MKPVIAMLAAVLALALVPAPGRARGPDWSGFVSADRRVGLHDEADADATFGKARLELGYPPSDTLFLRASAELRYYDLPAQEPLPEVPELESGYHSDVLLWEAYLAADSFVWSNLDVRVGKQRIAWGRADRFNPTDNLNPNDLTDPFDFGAKVPSWAALGTVYLGDSELAAVWAPVFQPALFARGGTVALLGVAPHRVERPPRTAENGAVALKFTSLAFNVDYSLSYLAGRDDLPVPIPTADGLVLRFPKREVLGFDFAGEAGSVGFRGEAARFRPQAVTEGPVVVLPAEPYTKYTLGVEYTFPAGTFVEAQLVHGFITERGADNLGDFVLLTAKQSFLGDDLKLSVTAAGETRDGPQGERLDGSGLFPELAYALTGSLELGGGAYLLSGEDGTLFGRLRDADQVYFKGTYRF